MVLIISIHPPKPATLGIHRIKIITKDVAQNEKIRMESVDVIQWEPPGPPPDIIIG